MMVTLSALRRSTTNHSVQLSVQHRMKLHSAEEIEYVVAVTQWWLKMIAGNTVNTTACLLCGIVE